MTTPTPHWRIWAGAWVPIGLAVVAEATSNALRAYGLGTHLEAFTTTVAGYTISIAGVVLVLAACAISLSQARAAWVAISRARRELNDFHCRALNQLARVFQAHSNLSGMRNLATMESQSSGI